MTKRESMLTNLREGACRVTFTKKNGDTREMLCTLEMRNIPEYKRPIGESAIKENPEVIRVFDMEKYEWRSFRVDSVTDFEIVPEPEEYAIY